MSTSGASFLIELSSATATKMGAPREARYRLRLTPGIDIPYLAEPRAQLEALTFANSFSNVDSVFYDNATIKVTWNPYVYKTGGASVTEPARHQKSADVTLPPGHYTVPFLQYKAAEMLYADRTLTELGAVTSGSEKSAATPYISPTSSLYSDMQILTKMPSTAPATLMTMTGSESDDYFLPVEEEAASLHAYVGGYIRLNHATVINARIVGIRPVCEDTGNGVFAKAEIQLDRLIGTILPSDAKKLHILPPSFKFASGQTASVAPTEVADADFLGYGAVGAAEPNRSIGSPWDLSLTVDEMRGIAKSKDPHPHSTLLAADPIHVRLLAMMPDDRTGLLETATASPLLKVDSASTVFTGALGYVVADLVAQNPFTHMSTPSAVGDVPVNRAIDASKPGELMRTTSVSFHCPSLVSSSYNQYGERAGALMANVPITVASNSVQAWQAKYDSSIPCSLHGGNIDSIDFFLTNQNSEMLDLMKQDWLATVRLSWDKPSAPPMGSFGADSESAYGLRDVIYAASQRNA